MTREQKLLIELHPGVILREEFLEPLNVSAARLARDAAIPESRVSNILSGKRRITPETAIALGAFFSVEPEFWLNLQSEYDLRKEDIEHGKDLRKRVKPLEAA